MASRIRPRPPRLARSRPLARGLLAWYPMGPPGGRTLFDLGPRGGLHGAIAAGVEWEPSPLGPALRLVSDATSHKVDLPDFGAGAFAGGAATFAGWLRLRTATPAFGGDTGLHALGGAGIFSHYPWTSGAAFLTIFRAARVDGIALRSDVDRASWHHIAVTTEPSGSWRFYQGGVEVHAVAAEASVTFPAAPVLGQSDGAYRFDGWLGEHAFWSRCLAAAEIRALAADPSALVRPADWSPAVLAATAPAGPPPAGPAYYAGAAIHLPSGAGPIYFAG